MIPVNYACEDVEGVFCISMSTTDSNEPNIITQYWPTNLRSFDVKRFFEIEEFSALDVQQTIPGEYFVGMRADYGRTWKVGQHIGLIDGGRTLPIKTTIVPATVPTVRRGTTIYWSGGGWVIHNKTSVRRVFPEIARSRNRALSKS